MTPIILLRAKRARQILSLSDANKIHVTYITPSIQVSPFSEPGALSCSCPIRPTRLKARRIVVAWKDTREARRAVRDALPFLKEAKEAMIVTVCEHGRCRGVVRVSPKKHVLRHRANRPVPLRCGLCLQRGACAQAYQCPAHASVGQRARELP
jgi:hypothetical protein